MTNDNDLDLNVDPVEKREELISDTEAAKRQAEQEQAELLEALEAEEEFEHRSYEWVEIGDVELKVKTWLPGDVNDTIQAYAEAEQSGDVPDFEPMIEAAKTQTEVVRTADVSWSTDAKISKFWDMYYSEHGSNVLLTVFDRVFDPAIDGIENKLPQSFQGQDGGGFRDGVERRP